MAKPQVRAVSSLDLECLSARRVAHDNGRVTRLLHLAGAVLAVLGWLALVRLAVRWGNDAQAGDTVAWAWLGLAAAGAVLSLLAALVLIRRLGVLVGLVSTYRPKRARR